MNISNMIRGTLGVIAGSGASIIATDIINAGAPSLQDPRKWVRFVTKTGRFALTGIASDIAKTQIQKQYDIIAGAVSETKDAIDEVKTSTQFRDITDRLKDNDDKKD